MSMQTIDHMIYMLSELGLYYFYHQPPTSRAISKHNQQLLRMLSLLSLIIVTEGSGDVAAVSLHATAGKGIELYYSKNHPCTPDETAYVIELFATATNSTSSTKQDDVSFATSNLRARVDGNPMATQCDAKIRKLVGTERFTLECSLVDFLKSWFQLLLSSLQHDPFFDLPANESLLRDTITISYFLAQEA
ncbi:hypothetical protein B9Z19DRAFT_1121769 [Tuber borchii]|uniref:Uncharacterized protein n=1 Tax=Tuber borchii TaxID=42251 RepID=A0A2T7A1Z7_TUBBO|nr:hypothetical protein B9Z19DRAFT_1121769 [Tuber borchii]